MRRHIASKVRLTCDRCSKRKIKCDKLLPCTNCRRSAVQCLPTERRRLPRGRSRRLENLPLQASLTISDTSVDIDGEINQACHIVPVWLQGEQGSATPNYQPGDPCGVINQHIQVIPNTIHDTARENLVYDAERQLLLHVYLAQVDSILNVVDGPSLQAHLLEGKCYLDYSFWHPAPMALTSAIYYAACCALTEDTCLLYFGTDKKFLISKYEKMTQSALEMADYLSSDDFTVLQAIVISLIALRCHDYSRRFWTMLALALQIARSLSLHEIKPQSSVNPFEREMHHRLWHAICWIDIQASLSNASEPMIRTNSHNFQSFLEMNDDYFSMHYGTHRRSTRKGSESTLFVLLSYAQEAARYLSMLDSVAPQADDLHLRQEIVMSFKHRAEGLVAGIQPEGTHFDWYVKRLAHSITVTMQLLAIRQRHKAVVKSSENSRASNVYILKLAAEILDSRRRIYTSSKARAWRWLEPLFFPWQALETGLTEVCACDDRDLLAKIWPCIEHNYSLFTTLGMHSPQCQTQIAVHTLMEQARFSYQSTFAQSFISRSGNFPLLPNLSPTSICDHHPQESGNSEGARSAGILYNPLPCKMDNQGFHEVTWYNGMGTNENGDYCQDLHSVDADIFGSRTLRNLYTFGD